MRRLILVVASCLFALSATNAAAADATADRLREALRKAREEVRKLEGERATWQSEKSEIEKTRADAESRSKEAAGQLDALRHALAAEQARAMTLDKQTDELKRRLKEMQRAQSALAEQLKSSRNEIAERMAALKEVGLALDAQTAAGTAFKTQVERYTRELAACERDNVGLSQVAIEASEKATDLNYWDGVLKREPLFQFKRVELESLMETYRDRIEKHRRDQAVTQRGDK